VVEYPTFWIFGIDQLNHPSYSKYKKFFIIDISRNYANLLERRVETDLVHAEVEAATSADRVETH
jgi:hypothetical protein